MRVQRLMTAAILLLMFLFAFGCSGNKSVPQETKSEEKAKPKTETAGNPNILTISSDSAKLAGLKYTEVAEEPMAAPLEVTGQVKVNEDSTVRVGSLFSGRILEVPVKVGDRVQNGQTLARLHTHEVHEAQAEYAKAKAELDQRKTQAEYAKSLLERAERLYQAKAISLNELEKVRVEYKAAGQEIARAEAELQRAIGHREHLGLPDKLDYDQPVIVRAPASGILMKREITPGASVSPGDNLFLISDLSSVWVIAEVPEKNLSLLKLGAPARIKVAAYPEASFTGRIARIGEMLNPETRTVEVRCLVDNRYGKLKLEMFATISLAIGDKRTALMVNQAALQEMDEQTVVFIARADNQFEKRAIKTGRKQGDLVEVVEGLSRGERVVTEGSFQIKSEFSKDKLADEK